MVKWRFISSTMSWLSQKLIIMKRPPFLNMDLGNMTKIYCKIIKPDIALETNLLYKTSLPKLPIKKWMKNHKNTLQGFCLEQDDAVVK